MGLYCSFTPEDLGYPENLETEVLGVHLEVPVDYSAALEGFVDTFLSVSTSLVPVDTGFLQSTLDAGSTESDAYAEASAEYAQYVEYGTWKMGAQPYFEPAVDEGAATFFQMADEAVEEASRILEDEAEAVMDEFLAEMEERMEQTAGSFIGNLAIAVVAFVVLFPVLVMAYGIMDSLGLTGSGTSIDITGSGGGGGMIDIEIT